MVSEIPCASLPEAASTCDSSGVKVGSMAGSSPVDGVEHGTTRSTSVLSNPRLAGRMRPARRFHVARHRPT